VTTQSIQSALDAGIQCHDAGNLKQAEQFYRQVLAADPRHAKATYLMGLLAMQVGKYELAVRILSNAIRLDGAQPTFHSKLGDAYRGLGKLPEAVTCYRQSIRMNGNNPEAINNLGTVLQAQGDLPAAVDCYRRAMQLNANYAEPHHNLGCALQQQGEREASAAAFAEAVRIRPDFFEAKLAWASMLLAQGKTDEAQARFEELARQHPDSAQLHLARGAGYQEVGDFHSALAAFRRAVELAPNYAEAHYNLGTALRHLDQDFEAIAAYEKATRINPRMAPAWSNLANTYLGLVRPDEAAEAARQAIALQPRSNMALGNLATALQLQGDMDGAIAAFRQAVECNPADAGNHSNLLYTLNFHPGYDQDRVFAEHLTWAARHAEPLTDVAAPHTLDRDPQRRLRIGYVSAHFRHHAVAFFSEPLLAAHDRGQFEIFCYADMRQSDETTARFRAQVDGWRDTTQLSHDQIAELVRQDRIDILVDLAGHIGDNRLPMFARKPAPVQVTYLGYQNTTGMSAMDYRLTDAHADPPDVTDRWYTERLVRLPGSFFCFAPPESSPPVGPLPAERSGDITFASLNHIHKLRPENFRAWARVLTRVPASRLKVLAYAPGTLERNVRTLMAEEGIDPGRIEVVNKRPRYDYLEMHNEIDVALDTFPFNGHTTVCDALWMGVPSIMLEGDRYSSRFGGSTLLGLGLGELIARSVDEYVELAVQLATDRRRLTELRGTLRERLLSSPLVDAQRFAREVEAAYRQMWRTWCAS
jgi:protein O-GlcNAc transferase